jgi:hypothetical protein
VRRAVVRLAADLAAEACGDAPRGRAQLRTLVVGMADWRTITGLETALGPVDVVPAPRGPALLLPEVPLGGFDVAVALHWLPALADPAAGLAELRRVAPAHLLLAVPSEPLAALGIRLPSGALGRGREGQRWSGSQFVRLVSRFGAVRDLAHPVGWIVVWVRRS